MVSIITGRKQFNINKNLESGAGLYNSPSYSKARFSPDLQIVPRDTSSNLDHIQNLKYILNEKEHQLTFIKENLQRPSQKLAYSPIYKDIISQSAYESKSCVDIYKNHYKELENQLKDKERKKIDEILNKQREIKARLHQMITLRDIEIKERKQNIFRVKEYRKHLDFQQKFNEVYDRNKISRSVTPAKYENFEKDSFEDYRKNYPS
ncbi:hypothetical protein SteCoe_23839 [Stentor coeruleus]|uniref:Uncharacterized protein n=1 Tax=Stentor coeruleus TaxID=5963 RepID=A0A1R2BJE3_9CILI|nr:hypothetical protein SteCoe_23839 [Stentor coeruleus]